MKSIKFIIPIIVLLFLLMPYLVFEREMSFLPRNVQKQDILKTDMNIPEAEKKALSFLVESMSGPQLSIYTNYLNTSGDKSNTASGQDILSESQGLLLLYMLNRNIKEHFDLCLHWTVNNLYINKGSFSWIKRKTSESEMTTALIDDLRIARALILAYEKWQDDRYLKLVRKLSSAMLKYNIQDLMPLDFYDFASRNKANCITISYADLYTMKKLALFDSRWEKVYTNSYELIKNAAFEGTGLYMFQYDFDKMAYSIDEDISLIQSVCVMLHQQETGQQNKQGTDWIWEQYLKHGKLFAVYSSSTFEPATDIESTALYALVARLFYESGDIQKAQIFIKECEKFQVGNEESEIYGAFGNDMNLEVYSFDNLEYILSSSIIFSNK
ncbi:endo-1,4-D-glucanase [Oxobacter pfennigii]|uniref:Endo-1,4-D-glucanase n=1 Tax=Oxobacter pfennigii TaxID=36849 RepID=A0A0P8X3B2_9CLOT|nr:glycosyl hydrolase family 8 [Oxobacter pfennigii]KPU45261.1 endo-1,4-D-glucanase [Oxobacter pfennigii]